MTRARVEYSSPFNDVLASARERERVSYKTRASRWMSADIKEGSGILSYRMHDFINYWINMSADMER